MEYEIATVECEISTLLSSASQQPDRIFPHTWLLTTLLLDQKLIAFG